MHWTAMFGGANEGGLIRLKPSASLTGIGLHRAVIAPAECPEWCCPGPPPIANGSLSGVSAVPAALD